MEEFTVPERPVNPSEEEKLINSYLNESEKEGDKWFIISATWFRAWKEYVRDETEDQPPIIDNSDIINPVEGSVDTGGFILIKDDSQMEIDYFLLPEKAWVCLNKWYKGGPEIHRFIVEEGHKKIKRVEVFFKKFYIISIKGKKVLKQIEVHRSKFELLKSLHQEGCQLLQIKNSKNIQLLSSFDGNFEVLDNLDLTIDDAQIIDQQKIYFGTQDDFQALVKTVAGKGNNFMQRFTSLFTRFKSTTTATVATVSSVTKSLQVPQWVGSQSSTSSDLPLGGVTGLANLGNTCFMNSALQCLVHCAALKEFFMDSEKVKAELNRENVFGMNGILAEQFAEVVRALWSGQFSYISPRNLKWVIGKFEPRFSGYQQHDSQEFLAFLLDGLHEDLNRITTRPQIKVKEKKLPDEQLAIEQWESHLKRNNSIIVDLFQAQLKNTLECPQCHKISRQFDPFMYLSVPIPQPPVRLEISLFTYDNEHFPKKYSLRISRTARVASLLEQLSALAISSPPQPMMTMINPVSSSPSTLPDLNFSSNNIGGGGKGDGGGGMLVSSGGGGGGAKAEFKNLLFLETDDKRISRVFTANQVVPGYTGRNNNNFYYATPIPSPPSSSPLLRIFFYQRKLNERNYPEIISLPYILHVWRGITGSQIYFLIWKRFQRHIVEQFRDSRFRERPFVENIDDIDALREYVTNEADRNDFKIDSLPFYLLHISQYGTMCSICKPAYNSKRCYGCDITLGEVNLDPEGNSFLAIQWKPELFYLYDTSVTSCVRLDASVKLMREESKKNVSSVNIIDCIDMFTQTEILGENDQWHCPSCKDFVCASKKIDLWSTPDVLIIHLKRFQTSRNGYREKLNTFVDYPISNLDLTRFVLNNKNSKNHSSSSSPSSFHNQNVIDDQNNHHHHHNNDNNNNEKKKKKKKKKKEEEEEEDDDDDHRIAIANNNVGSKPPIYHLFAVSDHHGSLHGGHYTAYAKVDDQWYSFNDSDTRVVHDIPQIKSSSNYLLFYERAKSLS